jgi:putative ABC transport system permease protein
VKRETANCLPFHVCRLLRLKGEIMLKNYFKIAFRNLTKHKVYSVINIFGLAVGIACCVLIGLYVQNEWSYDEFHSKSDRLYRAWVHEDYGNNEIYFNSVSPIVLKPTLEENIPEVESVSRFYNFNNLVKRPDDSEAQSETLSMVDPSFYSMFDFSLIKGNAETAFSNPGSVVITKETAERYFDDSNVLQQGLSIRIGDTYEEFTVTGVIENPPNNSSLQFQFLIPFSNSPKIFGEGAHTNWFSVSPETYVLLQQSTEAASIDPKLKSMMQGVLGDRYSESNYTVGLQPITDIHLNTEIPNGIAPVSDPTYSYILGAIALLILLIACVNFMTLSISRSTSRAKEVGIRKTIGAIRQHLMYQFWGEALLMTVLAFAFGIFMAEMLLPYFNALSGKSLQLGFSVDVVLYMTTAALLISLISGIYPALILSGFKPVEVLKGRLNLSADKNLFRQAMVVFQFTLSIALIAGTLIINSQLDYVRSKDLGFQKEQIVVLDTDIQTGPGNPFMKVIEQSNQITDRIRSEVSSNSDIAGVSMAVFTPVQQGGWINADFRESDGRKRDFNFNIVDHQFLDTYQINVVDGRDFSEENTSDARRAIVVNQALVDDYGWENPIGQRLPGPNFEDHEIIGVVENFHYMSLHAEVEPLVLAINPVIPFSGIDNIGFTASPTPRISLRISSENIPVTMDFLEKTWSTTVSGAPFNYTFVDQAVDSQYRQEERLSEIVMFGSVLAIVIACLGLFGLASLMIVRRTKEIGVRKVLGATSTNIVVLVNKEFTKLVAIAFVIASPIAWLGMQQWLRDFAYRIEIGVGVFLLSGLIALAIAWITVSYQSIKATLINPVESLRSE